VFTALILSLTGGRAAFICTLFIYTLSFFFTKLPRKIIFLFVFFLIFSVFVRINSGGNFLNSAFSNDIRITEVIAAHHDNSFSEYFLGVGFGKKINVGSTISTTSGSYDIHNGFLSSFLYLGFFPSLIYLALFLYYPYIVFKDYKFISLSFFTIFFFESISGQGLLFSSEGILMLIFFYSTHLIKQKN
jgi:hypothetical protein